MAYLTSSTEDIIYKTLCVLVSERTSNRNLSDENSINEFNGTFLSNFYPVSIHYCGKRYPSVEHAYQAQKFEPGVLKCVPREHHGLIIDALRVWPKQIDFQNLTILFLDRTISPRHIKLFADCLGRVGYIRDDWNDIRIRLMIELLQRKFSHADLQALLLATNKKYLIENNYWGDTLWGVCDGRGFNLLGHILMILRDVFLTDRGSKRCGVAPSRG